MGATIITGPHMALGPLLGGAGLNELDSNYGPAITYHGEAIPDVRATPVNKDNMLPGTVKSHLSSTGVFMVDAVPSQLVNNNIAAAQLPTSGTPLTLAAASAGIATKIPFLPFGTNAPVVANIALDFGFQLVNCTANSTTIVVTDSTQFRTGMPLIVANVGNAGGTTALLTYVASITDATHIVVGNAPLATNSSTPAGTGNSWGALYNGGNIIPAYAQPYSAAGDALIMNPMESISRGVRIVGTSLTAGGAVTIAGYDIYGQPQTQTLTLASGSTTQWSTKTWKYIQSITPAFTDGSHNISVGTSDVFGVTLRNDKWEYVSYFWAGASLGASTGWTAADTTSPATATTGDVRGTIQIGTNGPLGSGATGGASDGTKRLVLAMDIPLYNLVRSGPINSVPLYGVLPV